MNKKMICYIFCYLENQLLLISSNFTPKTSHSCLKKWYTRFSRYAFFGKKSGGFVGFVLVEKFWHNEGEPSHWRAKMKKWRRSQPLSWATPRKRTYQQMYWLMKQVFPILGSKDPVIHRKRRKWELVWSDFRYAESCNAHPSFQNRPKRCSKTMKKMTAAAGLRWCKFQIRNVESSRRRMVVPITYTGKIR